MALIRVAQYSSTPTVVGDYQAQNAHLQAFTNQLMTQQFILDSGTAQPVIKQGCYISHGGSLYVADADTAITGSPADGSVYIRVSGTTSLTVEFVTDISGYAWNPVYAALTSTTYTLLPYLIVKASTVWTRYNFNPNNQCVGNIKATSIDTGQGANELYKMDQDVETTDAVEFAGIEINSSAYNTQTISMGSGEWIIPKGLYLMRFSITADCYIYNGSTWLKLASAGPFIISDGTSVKLVNTAPGTNMTVTYRKF